MTMIMMMDSCNTKSFHQEPTTVVEDSNAVVMLPEDFQPGETEVIIGRGKKCATHSGNRRFRELVNEELTEYSEATTKAHKSTIIVRILTQVRALSPHPFVKQDLTSRRWYSVGESAQRNTTVSGAMQWRVALFLLLSLWLNDDSRDSSPRPRHSAMRSPIATSRAVTSRSRSAKNRRRSNRWKTAAKQ